jgi:hypothetical protein
MLECSLGSLGLSHHRRGVQFLSYLTGTAYCFTYKDITDQDCLLAILLIASAYMYVIVLQRFNCRKKAEGTKTKKSHLGLSYYSL